MVTVDYFSNFAEIDSLSKMTSRAVIKNLKAHFARHGIPDVVVSDNGPQFSSEEFHGFSRDWEFTHVTSSPAYPQANGKAESAIKQVKRFLLKRAQKAESDPMLALLGLRNTPMEGHHASPAQLIYSRRCKTLLPIAEQLLQPEVVPQALDGLRSTRAKQAAQYNKQARDLPQLKVGDMVRMQPVQGEPEWKKGVVINALPHRSFEVQVGEDRVYRRNRRQLRKSQERPPTSGQSSKSPTEETDIRSDLPEFVNQAQLQKSWCHSNAI